LPILKSGAELIVVDARSHDNTIELILEFLNKHEIIFYKIASQLNSGLYEAFNLAVEYSCRQRILFLHSDDVLKKSQTIIKDVNNSKSDVIFYGIQIENKSFKRKWHIPNLAHLNVKSMHLPPHAGILVSRNVYSKIGKFRTHYKIAGDFDWMLRLLFSSNISFSFSNEITYIQKSGGVSNSGLTSEITKFKEDVKVLKSLGIKFPVYKVFLKKINKLYQLNKI
jgi:glycosyltransferase